MSDSEQEGSDEEALIGGRTATGDGGAEYGGFASDEEVDRRLKGEIVTERKERTCKICSTSGMSIQVCGAKMFKR